MNELTDAAGGEAFGRYLADQRDPGLQVESPPDVEGLVAAGHPTIMEGRAGRPRRAAHCHWDATALGARRGPDPAAEAPSHSDLTVPSRGARLDSAHSVAIIGVNQPRSLTASLFLR
jgi:hypothetical protein